MANNVDVTPGSGATVATDQLASGAHVQLIKLMDGAEDGTARIGGDATNGLDVDVTRVQGTVTVDTELTLEDLDTGAGTVNRPAVALYLPASGGPVLAPGDGTNGLKTQITTAPSATRTSDGVTATLAVDRLANNLTMVTPSSIAIQTNTLGDTTLIAAQGAGNIICVHAVALMAAGTTTVRFESGTGGAAKTGTFPLIANVGFVLPFNPVGWFKTAADTLLNLELSAAIMVSGVLVYTVIT